VTRGAAALALAAALACALAPPRACAEAPAARADTAASPGSAAAASAAPGDTVRGTVEEAGSEPATVFLLRTPGGRIVRLDGSRAMLGSVAGLEVVARGARTAAGHLQVVSLSVRAADGLPAVDGELSRAGSGWVLVTDDGYRLDITRLPDALLGQEGAHVWLAGPPNALTTRFGIVSPP
jgi:hypothetical protein